MTDWHDAGCARDCSEQHTYTWGRCALAPESARPQPTISIGRVEKMTDGYPGIVMRSVPLSAWDALITVAKWVSRGKSMALDADPEIALAYPDAAARRALGALDDAGLLGREQPAPAEETGENVGYCPSCGRGNVAPTAEEYEQQRQRAEQAEAAIARVRALTDLIEAGAPWVANHDTIAARIREAVADRPPADGHVYLSTGCRHGDHTYCQNHTGQSGQKTPAQCKFCGSPCVCGCHQETAVGPLVDRPFRSHRQPTTEA